MIVTTPSILQYLTQLYCIHSFFLNILKRILKLFHEIPSPSDRPLLRGGQESPGGRQRGVAETPLKEQPDNGSCFLASSRPV